MNLLLPFWLVICMAMPFVVLFNVRNGNSMTKREFLFFTFGLFVSSVPFYLIGQ